MGYALRASLWLFKFDPVKFVGSALQHKFIPDEFVFTCPKKSNQKKRVRRARASHSRSPDEVKRNPGFMMHPRIPLRCIRATLNDERTLSP
jgi:hypothetical protein